MRVKNCIKNLGVSLIAIFCICSLARADSPATPWSQVITSSNGKYVLVLISPKVKEQEECIFQSREFWREGGIPAENVPEAEKALQKEIDKEAAIRKKYLESGLYTAGKSPKLLWKTDLFDMKVRVKVSDDGEHIITIKDRIAPIFEEAPLEYNPDVKKVNKVYPNMEETVLTFYSFGKPIRSYKASELTATDENLQRDTSNNFIWTTGEVPSEKTKTLSITKTNAEKLIFDMNGNLIGGKLTNQRNSTSKSEVNTVQPPKSENSKSFCGGVALLFGLVVSLLLGR